MAVKCMLGQVACLCLGFSVFAPGLSRAWADWPQFRGPLGNGLADADSDAGQATPPLRWSESEHVRWKCAIPHSGLSTPVVMEGKVWLTTATEEGHEALVICVDAESGVIRLNRKLFDTEAPEPLGNRVNGYASPSPVVEPGRVYVSFGSTGTACLDTSTFEVLWSRRDLPCRHYRGAGSSPILFDELLILTMDGVDQQYLVALDKATGRTVWRTDRSVVWDDLDAEGRPFHEGDLRKAFSTPLMVEFEGRTEMISAGSKAAYAYDPLTGRELWQVRHHDHSSSVSPVAGEGLAFVCTGFARSEVLAIRLGGTGDVTETHVVWRKRRAVPKMPSPLLLDNRLYLLADNGSLSCLEATTGRELWHASLEGAFTASLLSLAGHIYCFNQTGVTTVVEEGDAFHVVAENRLDGGFMASPAVADNALFLRTKTHLYRVDRAGE